MVEDLTRAVRNGDWAAAYAVGEQSVGSRGCCGLSNVFAIDADDVGHLDHEGINAWPLNRHRGFLAKGRQ
jgi:hypothetical protein